MAETDDRTGIVVIRNGKRLEVPMSVENEGPEAMEKFITEKLGPVKAAKKKEGADARS